MHRYLARRTAAAIPLVLGIATIVFFVISLAPGDPTRVLVSPGMRPEVIAQVTWAIRIHTAVPCLR